VKRAGISRPAFFLIPRVSGQIYSMEQQEWEGAALHHTLMMTGL
jgi:hypothetical protein